MTTPTTPAVVAEGLTRLADRCEQASGPDREADLAIHALIDPEQVEYWDADYAEMKAAIEARGPEAVQHRLPGLRQHTHRPPRYTASLDAAMTLADPSWWLQMGGPLSPAAYGYSREYDRKLRVNFQMVEAPYSAGATGQTLPLALCTAALRARAHLQECSSGR